MQKESKRAEQLRQALSRTEAAAVVVSGPFGSGKSTLIRALCRDLAYDCEEIDSLAEYSSARLAKSTVYLLDTDDLAGLQRADLPYRRLVVETRNHYLYKRLPGSIPVKVRRGYQKEVKELSGGLAGLGGNLHLARAVGQAPERTRAALARFADRSADPESFFHLLGKILYRKTAEVPDDVLLRLAQESQWKVLLYLHENLPAFTPDIHALCRILAALSDIVEKGATPGRVSLFVRALWKEEKCAPPGFFQLTPPSEAFLRQRPQE